MCTTSGHNTIFSGHDARHLRLRSGSVVNGSHNRILSCVVVRPRYDYAPRGAWSPQRTSYRHAIIAPPCICNWRSRFFSSRDAISLRLIYDTQINHCVFNVVAALAWCVRQSLLGKAVALMCASLNSDNKLNDIRPRYLAWWFMLTLYIVHEPDQILVPPGWAKPTNYFLKALCL